MCDNTENKEVCKKKDTELKEPLVKTIGLKEISISELKINFEQLVTEDCEIIITKYGKPIAAIVGINNYNKYQNKIITLREIQQKAKDSADE